MTIQEAIVHYSNILNDAKIEVPSLDVEVLITYVLNKEKSFLYAHPEQELEQAQQEELVKLVQKRSTKYPLAYLTHSKSFFDLDLYVDENVLIPRPETELLVQEVASYVNDSDLHIADIGTGSGAIAISLKKQCPNANITATDISPNALEVAKKNAHTYNVDISFDQEDLFETLPENIDVLVSNPPYVKTELVENLIAEPIQALDGGHDGLDVYRALFGQIKAVQIPAVFLEIGYDQAFEIEQLKHEHLPNYSFEILSDYCGFPRVVKMFLK